MMGAVPGSSDTLALLAALADPVATKAKLAEIVTEQAAATKARDEANKAQADLAAAQASAANQLNDLKLAADASIQEATQRQTAANEAMTKLDTEYKARGDMLDARERSVNELAVQQARDNAAKEAELQALIAAATKAEADTKTALDAAQTDAAEAAKTRALYDSKLAALQKQINALGSV